jgi:hypothetical protein
MDARGRVTLYHGSPIMSPRHRRKLNRTVVDRRHVKVDRSIRADRITFQDWLRALAHKRLRVVVQHPHHYATAAGLSGIMAMAGHFDTALLISAFAYAIVENVVSAAD